MKTAPIVNRRAGKTPIGAGNTQAEEVAEKRIGGAEASFQGSLWRTVLRRLAVGDRCAGRCSNVVERFFASSLAPASSSEPGCRPPPQTGTSSRLAPVREN